MPERPRDFRADHDNHRAPRFLFFATEAFALTLITKLIVPVLFCFDGTVNVTDKGVQDRSKPDPLILTKQAIRYVDELPYI